MRRSAIALSAAAVTLIGAGWAVTGCSVAANTDVRSYQVTGDISALSVRNPVGAIEVTAGPGPVQITETIRYTNGKPDTGHATDGGTLRLTNGCPGHRHLCQVDYRVRMPAATSLDVDGSVGLVKLTRLGGDVSVTTMAGDVEASGLTSAHTTVRGNAGHISLRYASAPVLVDVTNDAGAIEVHVPKESSYLVDAHTDAGKTTVSVPQDPASSRRISAHNDAGAIIIGT